MDRELVDQVVVTAAKVAASGAIGPNMHGNVSVRVPGADEMYCTACTSMRDHPREFVVRVRLDGTLLEGTLPPIQGAVVDMHASRYVDDDAVGCVIHTHAPYATGFATAHRSIGCWIEALAMFGLAPGVPLAGYAPRGSEGAVDEIRKAVIPGVPAVLLANHGVLVFHRSPDLAVLVNGVVEEAAAAGFHAAALGGPVDLPEEMKAAALQRAMAFDQAGDQTASGGRS
jgi:L-ribulose-5-phosphate 4-epimerase